MSLDQDADTQSEEILQACGTLQSEQVYFAHAFAEQKEHRLISKDISIMAQRRRSLNLAWALVHREIVTKDTTVGIVGCGFSGMALAVSLSLQTGCIVQVFEREEEILSRFKNAPYRHLSTKLNVSGRYGSDSYHDPDPDRIPIFRWESGTAAEIANIWETEFHFFQSLFPIFLHTGIEITAVKEIQSGNLRKRRVVVQSKQGAPQENPAEFPVDVLIVATGFGTEQKNADIGKYHDYSYWLSGTAFHYSPNKSKEKILVAGGGDSGLLEVLHYSIRDFEHRKIEDLAPVPSGGLTSLHNELDNIEFLKIVNSSPQPALDQSIFDRQPDQSPALIWFLGHWTSRIYYGRSGELDWSRPKESAYDAIRRVLDRKGLYTEHLEGRIVQDGSWVDSFIENGQVEGEMLEIIAKMKEIEGSIEQEIIDAVDPFLAAIYSHEVCAILGKFFNDRDFNFLKDARNPDFDVTWAVGQFGPIGPRISEPLLGIAWALKKTSIVRIVNSRLLSLDRDERGWRAEFAEARTMKSPRPKRFDRVATRFGLSQRSILWNGTEFSARNDAPKDVWSSVMQPYVHNSYSDRNWNEDKWSYFQANAVWNALNRIDESQFVIEKKMRRIQFHYTEAIQGVLTHAALRYPDQFCNLVRKSIAECGKWSPSAFFSAKAWRGLFPEHQKIFDVTEDF